MENVPQKKVPRLMGEVIAWVIVACAAFSPALCHSIGGSTAMGFEEKLGNLIPLETRFAGESGDSITLGKLIQKPTVLCLLYYRCPNACNTLLSGLAHVLQSFADKPQSAPNIVTISIDENETPADAARAKSLAFQIIERPYPPEKWHFLTGSDRSIDTLAEAVGFHFVKKGNDFDHPLGLIILSPAGKVVRYITGADFLPVDLSMSLMEASSGTVQPTIARVLRACFSYDPVSRRFVFNILKVSATVIFALLGLFIGYLIISGNARRVGGKRT